MGSSVLARGAAGRSGERRGAVTGQRALSTDQGNSAKEGRVKRERRLTRTSSVMPDCAVGRREGEKVWRELWTCQVADGEERACNTGDVVLILGWGRSPGEENDNPPQCSSLGNPMDRGAWWATVHGVPKSQT